MCRFDVKNQQEGSERFEWGTVNESNGSYLNIYSLKKLKNKFAIKPHKQSKAKTQRKSEKKLERLEII